MLRAGDRRDTFVSFQQVTSFIYEVKRIKVGSAMITHVRYGQNQAQNFT